MHLLILRSDDCRIAEIRYNGVTLCFGVVDLFFIGLPWWRNGIRARLKIAFPKGIEGSSPSHGTSLRAARLPPSYGVTGVYPAFMIHFLRTRLFHRLYDLTIIIKGIDGVLEFIGGLLLLFISHTRLDAITVFLTQHELSQDPNDKISNFLVDYVHDLPHGVQLFGAVYLLAHGVLKIFLAYNLFREKRWVFPYAIAILSLFVAYQCYRLFVHFSYGILFITLLDLLVIWFIAIEYRVIRYESFAVPLPQRS